MCLLALAAGQRVEGCQIEGQVLNQHGNTPVRNVKIYVQFALSSGSGSQAQTSTGSDGRFCYPTLAPGRYRLWAEANGFLNSRYGARAPSDLGAIVTVPAEGAAPPITWTITPAAAIAGRVLNDDGEPVADVDVVAIQLLSFRSRSRFIRSEDSTTDDRGEFRIGALPPGRYVIAAAAPESSTDLAPTYFPRSTDPARAEIIDLPAGRELTGLQIQLVKTPVFRIRGRITGPKPGGVLVQVVPADPAARLAMFDYSAVYSSPDGSFDMDGVAPGSYWLVSPAGRAPVDVAGANVENVILRSSDDLQLTVRLRGAAGKPVRMTLLPAGFATAPPPSAAADASGNLRIPNPPRSVHRLLLTALPGGVYVKAATLNGRPLPDRPLDLTDAAGPLAVDIQLAPGAGIVEGAARSGDATAPAGTVVYAVPAAAGAESLFAFATAITGEDGRYRLTGLAPGDYRLFALDENSATQSVPFSTMLQEGTAVTIPASGRVQADPQLLKP